MKINKTKLEKLNNLANFGKLSAGIIHDLINPLTALMLNLEQIKKINKNKEIKDYLRHVTIASLSLKNILINAKEQISHDDKKIVFNPSSEIKKIILILSYQLKKEKIDINLITSNNLKIFGSKIKFNRIISNLLINAIEACEKTDRKNKKICIKITKSKKILSIKIIDNGCGIPETFKQSLFLAFASKKNSLGLGLYLVKKIIEEDFNGEIKYHNNNSQTIFQIKLNCLNS